MNLAVFLPNWVGDVVMATPAVRALRRSFPDARLIGVMKPYVADVLAGTNWLDAHVYLDNRGPLARRWWGAAWRLRPYAIDTAVLFPNSFRSALVAWLGRCRRRVGYARYGRSPLLTDKLEPKRDAAGRIAVSPVLDAYNLLAERAGAKVESLKLELATTDADESAADDVWEHCRLSAATEIVCLNPGAAFGAAKHWPAEYFGELARRLIDRRGCKALVLCGPGERDLARQIVQETRRPGYAYSLADMPLSLGLTKACVRRCDLLVTTDSGPRHFAAAFDRPVVTLFGPTHIAWTETYHRKAVHLQKQVPCGPCQRRTCPYGHHRCMTELTPAEVFHACEQLLADLARFPLGSRHAG